MSLQSELTDLTTNLSAAKAAVVTKGGTVGDTGLAGLEAEILSIPTTRSLPWGELSYYSVYTPASATTQSSTNLTFNSVSQDGLVRFIDEVLHVQSSQTVNSWWWMDNGQLMSYWDYGSAGNIPASYLASNYGINVSMTDQSQSNSQWVISYTPVSVDKTSQIASAELSNQTEYNSLGGQRSAGDTITIGSTTILWAAIQKFTFGSTPTSVPNYFLSGSGAEEIDWSLSSVTTLGNYFCSDCTSLDYEINFPDTLTTIGDYFHYGASSFDRAIIGNGVTSIGSYFSTGSSKLNSNLIFPALTTISDHFLYGNQYFDHSLDFPSLTTIGDYFLASCRKYNRTTSFYNVTTIGNYFLQGDYALNDRVLFNNATTIGNYFMAGCYGTASEVSLPKAVTIGSHFLDGCTKFNTYLTIPATVTSIGEYFLYNCKNMTNTIRVECAATVAATSDYSFSTDSNTAASYTTGMNVFSSTTGYEAAWKSRFPNRTSTPYRKIV